MFLIRLKPMAPLVEAISPLTRIATKADLRLSPTFFSLTVSQCSPPFIALLQLPSQFFTSFLANRNLIARICLDSFHSVLLGAIIFPAITILLQENRNQFHLLLRFENARNLPRWSHELELSPSEEEDVGKIDYTNCVSIDSTDFKRIVTKLSVSCNKRICVSLTGSQIKLSVATEEIVLTKEGGECVIVGFAGKIETQFQITLHPELFFHDLTNKPGRVWFFKSTDPHGVIYIPLGLYAHYLVYFPQK